MDSHKLIIILGMHRSGTSALSGLIDRLGYNLGDRLVDPSEDNVKGYYENYDIAVKNETIFSTLGTHWYDPSPLPEGWWRRPELDLVKREIKQLLDQQFTNSQYWAIKDPRICRLLPLWLDVLSKRNIDVSFLIMMRPPEEVAASLHKRDQMSLNFSTALWLSYILDAERFSRGYPRAIVSFDQLMNDWHSVADVIHELNPGSVPPLEQVAEQIDGFLTPSLRHHKKHTSNVRGLSLLLPTANSVYESMFSVDGPDIAYLDNLTSEMTELARIFSSEDLDDEVNRELTDEWLYHQWRQKHTLRASDGETMANRMIGQWTSRPTIHILILASEDEVDLLVASINGLSAQLYKEWALTVIAPFEAISPTFDSAAHLQWINTDAGETVVADVIASSNAEWFGVLSAGDTLEPHALFSFADYINIRPRWALIYSDHDRLAEGRGYHQPHFKPDVNIELIRSQPYIGRFALGRRDLVHAATLGAEPFGYSAYTWMLRALESLGPSSVGHIDDILFHQSDRITAKYDGADAQQHLKRLLEQHLKRCRVDASITTGYLPQSHLVAYSLSTPPLLSILIPHRDALQSLHQCIESLLTMNNYQHFELVIADMNSRHESCREYYSHLDERLGGKLQIVNAGEVSYPEALNVASREATGDYLLCLDHRVLSIQDSALERMLAICVQPGVGVVSPRLISAKDSTVINAGTVLGLGGIYQTPFYGQTLDSAGYQGRALMQQEYSAARSHCMIIERVLFNELGGFKSDCYRWEGFDIDLCLRAGKQGSRVVWTPYVNFAINAKSLEYQEGELARDELEQLESERAQLLQEWLPILAADPAYNRHLSLGNMAYTTELEFSARWDIHFHDKPRVLGLPLSPFLDALRLSGPLEKLDEQATIQYMQLLPIEAGDHPLGPPRVMSPVELERMKPDVLVMQSVISDEQIDSLELYKRYNSCRIIYDLEDLKTLFSEKNSRASSVPVDIASRIRRSLAVSDRLWVSTQPIADAHQDDIADIRLIPNYLSRSVWGDIHSLRRAGNKPRVGWAGAAQHHGDLEYIVDVVKATSEEVEWIFMGMCLDELKPYVAEIHEFVDHTQYPKKLASLNLDLAIAPLEHHPFNVAKSNLRLLEYGIMGWPVICTDIEPYQDAPVTRVDNNTQSWISAIREKLADPEKTAAQGDALREWVLRNYMLEDHLANITDALLA